MVAAGVHEAADIMVSHPIRIIGAGSSGSAVLSCDVPGATAAISFQSSGEVSHSLASFALAPLHHSLIQ